MARSGYGSNTDVPQDIYYFVIELLNMYNRPSIASIIGSVEERFGYTVTREQVLEIMEVAKGG
jgi:hypothetical protein